MTLAARLQRSTGAAVIMVFAERLPAGRGYRLQFERVPTRDFDEAALNRAVEAVIRQNPAQYLWAYNRYKVPAGVEPPPAGEGT
jgi:KDO2-lipid IV(A) lauroyltransferase